MLSMPELFKLVEEKYSEIDKEFQWTYSCLSTFTFKKRTIRWITITDHYRQEHSDVMTDELILAIMNFELNGRQRMKPVKRCGQRDIYLREWVPYGERDYLLLFWFKDNTDNHLWVRNCYPNS